jgi:hypothetical protein
MGTQHGPAAEASDETGPVECRGCWPRGRTTYLAAVPDPEQAVGTAVTLAGLMLSTLDARARRIPATRRRSARVRGHALDAEDAPARR